MPLSQPVSSPSRRPMLVIINGTPQSGKDHAARALMDNQAAIGRPVRIYRISDALKTLTHLHYGLTCAVDAFESVKDEPRLEFAGLSPRDAYCRHWTHSVLPAYGPAGLGEMLAERIRQDINSSVIPSDTLITLPGAGCWPEVEPIVADFGDHNTVLIRIPNAPSGSPTDYRGRLEELEGTNATVIETPNRRDAGFSRSIVNAIGDYLSCRALEVFLPEINPPDHTIPARIFT